MLSGERLKYTRKFRGFTLEELSERIKLTSNSSATKGVVSRWENGKAIPRVETIHLLANILDVENEFLMGLNTFAFELKTLRFKNKLTIKELANKSTINEDLLVLYEDGFEIPSLHNLNLLGKSLEIENFQELLVEKGIKLYPDDLNTNTQFKLQHTVELDKILKSDLQFSFEGNILSTNEKKQVLQMLEVLLKKT